MKEVKRKRLKKEKRKNKKNIKSAILMHGIMGTEGKKILTMIGLILVPAMVVLVAAMVAENNFLKK